MEYRESLIELISLLEKSQETNWVSYFNEALSILDNGKKYKSFEHTIGAYGGMGSFGDITLNFLDEDEYKRALGLRGGIYKFSKSHRNIFWSWFGK